MSKYPNLFIVGAAKAGTTSLYEYLTKSDEVFMSPVKEPHYFSKVQETKKFQPKKYKTGQKYHSIVIDDENEYLSLFNGSENFKYIGEASPSYLYDTHSAKLIREKSVDAKIIIVLRNPIDRAYSHYLMDYREGIQTLTFDKAIKEDLNQKKKGWGVSHLYIELGMYYEQVKQYLDLFEKENLLILEFSELQNDLNLSLKRISQFLNISDSFINELDKNEKHNVFASPSSLFSLYIIRYARILKFLLPNKLRSFVKNNILLRKSQKPIIDDKTKDYLINIYQENINKLNDLLNRNYSNEINIKLK